VSVSLHDHASEDFLVPKRNCHDILLDVVLFAHEKIFTGVVMKGHAHSITYKMAAVLGGFVLFIIMLCLTAALLTLKKQASIYSAHENEADEEGEEGEDGVSISQQSK
jgi:hypothetical protein